ncbi:MAG: efflux RND transporter permease subunit [Spirochaetota bacterium]
MRKRPQNLYSLPGRLYVSGGRPLIVTLLALAAGAIVLLTGLTFDPGYGSMIPPDDPYLQEVRAAEQMFGTPELITVAVGIGHRLDRDDLERIAAVTTKAQRVAGVDSATSVTNLTDLFRVGDRLTERPVFRPDESNHEQAVSRINGTPLFRKLFISRDGEASFVYVVPQQGGEAVHTSERLINALSSEGVTLGGDPVIHSYALDLVRDEVTTLGLLALAMVIAVQIVITRSFVAGACLAFTSALPAVWTLALFPLFGRSISISSAGTPVVVLLLATSYSIHVYRRAQALDFDLMAALDEVTEVIAFAGVTTIAGFLSLAASPGELLRTMGIYVALGSAFALVCALVLLPRLLGWWAKTLRRPRPRPGRHASLPSALVVARRPWLRAGIAALVVAICAAGVPSIRSRASYRDAFASEHVISRIVAYFEERTGTDNELSLIVETGEEYGLVDLRTYRGIKDLQAQLAGSLTDGYTVAYTDVVEWFLGRLEGRVEPVEPQSETEIGEALELLAGEEGPFGIEAMTNTAWDTARILAWVNVAGQRDPASVIKGIRAAASRILPDARLSIVGLARLHLRRTEYLMRSQAISLVLFFTFLTLLLLRRFRSWRWALIASLPTVAGVAVYFGLMGWLGILHDPTHVVMICALLGISNDDVLYFLIAHHQHGNRRADLTFRQTGVAIVQTTVILAAGLAVFSFSSVRYFSAAGALLTVGLVVATATTLLVVPGILERWEHRGSARIE